MGDGISDNNDVAIIDASCTFIPLQASAIGSRFLLFAPAGSYLARLEGLVYEGRDTGIV